MYGLRQLELVCASVPLLSMVVTAEVSQGPIGWLKVQALKNMYAMSTTAEVFQARMSSLKPVSK